MSLTTDDLAAIEKVVEKLLEKHLNPIKTDLSKIKVDVELLARLNQLDEIRKEPRLRAMYKPDQQEA